jgi:hypothetical protein
MAVERIKAGRLGVDDDLTHGKASQKVHQKSLIVI